MSMADGMRNEDLGPLADMLSDVSGVPLERLAGFMVMIAMYEEDGRPGARVISSTTDLRNMAQMLNVALTQVQGELDKIHGLS
jgi:hypothetical protein